MTEIEQIQNIMLAKAVYALSEIQRTVGRFKNQKRALNRIEAVASRSLHEIDVLKETVGMKIRNREGLGTIKF
ncbi:MAG: hypothetical protein PHS53_00265 [Candidatus Pacebacteria bacterium]|nr:hypothetical protein [Candidatus Paceibacterota bacterium]